MKNIQINYQAILPDLVASNVSKWYLFKYGSLHEITFIKKIVSYYNSIGIKEFEIDIFHYFNVEEFIPYAKRFVPIESQAIMNFFEEEIINNQSREIFIETGCITNSKGCSIIYFDKSSEVMLIGIGQNENHTNFEKYLKPYESIALHDIINYLYNVVFLDKNIGEIFIKKFIDNYFHKELKILI